MKIAAKPTMYRSVQFRSRLEARWAAFFDRAGWKWDYEPFDLEGWVPDFVLYGADNQVLCEVKPIDWIAAAPELILYEPDLAKVRSHRTNEYDYESLKRELLVLGNGPQRVGSDWVIGVFADEAWGCEPDWAALGYHHGALDFYSPTGAFAYRISGAWDGNDHIDPVNDSAPQTLWRAAGNVVQWNGPFRGGIGNVISDVVFGPKGEEP